jgi:hypothetical protein
MPILGPRNAQLGCIGTYQFQNVITNAKELATRFGKAFAVTHKMNNELHAKRWGWLKNGNPPGSPWTAARCGARTRRSDAKIKLDITVAVG